MTDSKELATAEISVAAQPVHRLDAFEKAQRNLLEDLEKRLIQMKAEYNVRVDSITDFYNNECNNLRAKVDEWMKLIKQAEENISQLCDEKRTQLTEFKLEHNQQVDAQERMIKFQRDGLEKLRT